MKSIDNKKAQTFDGKGFSVVNKGILTMSNITHITEANQVQISEHQLERFVDFINNAEEGFSALETLVRLIMEKSEKHTTAYTLAAITWDKLDDWVSACHEEIGYFKQHSPKVANLVLKESVA
jgi:site-specific recombinase